MTEGQTPWGKAPPQPLSVRYFDNHFHARRAPLLSHLMREKAQRACGGCAEPNTKPHLTSYDHVVQYIKEMLKATQGGSWVASIYLTHEPNLRDIERLWREGLISHIKVYPSHGSTNTDEAPPQATLLDKGSGPGKALCLAEELGLPVKLHAEHAAHGDDPYLREESYIFDFLPRFRATYQNLRIILAHLSSAAGADHMLKYGDPWTYVGELTAHHIAFHRGVMYNGGAIIPDHHCLPVIKGIRDFMAVRDLIKRRPMCIMAGSDAAAHPTKAKYRFDAFGGLYTYHCDLELYVQTLEELGVLDYADDFLYGNAKRFHGTLVPDNPERVKLIKETWTVESRIKVPEIDDEFTPFGFHPDPKKRFGFKWKIAA